MTTSQLLLFVGAGLLLNLTPGPDVLYIVTSALRRGARGGMVAALGIGAGCFVHILAAAWGLSALLLASATAFAVLKWAGALYLTYVGVRMLRAPARSAVWLRDGAVGLSGADEGLRGVFVRGFGTNALNPKVALFFLAFLPQFRVPGDPHQALTFIGLGLLFNVNALWVNVGWALLAAWITRRAHSVQRYVVWMDRVAGAVFIGFGLKLAFTDNPSA